MKKTKLSKTASSNISVDESVSLEEQIAKRAHELWHARDRRPGSDLEDWFQAEREIGEWHRLHAGKPDAP